MGKLKKPYDERMVIEHLARTKGSLIVVHSEKKRKLVEVDRNATIGIKAQGLLDFLVNHCGYIRLWKESRKGDNNVKEGANKPNKKKKPTSTAKAEKNKSL